MSSWLAPSQPSSESPPRGSLTERVKTPELIKRPFRSDGGERAEREVGALPSKSV